MNNVVERYRCRICGNLYDVQRESDDCCEPTDIMFCCETCGRCFYDEDLAEECHQTEINYEIE